jgi:tetratricopeptide (TPR) repeat protein
MKRANLYDVTAGNSRDIKRQLLRMLKDEKNREYLDQVYYALAQIEEKEKNIPGAKDYLRQSVKNSSQNIKQKGFSYLKLADIHFEELDYKTASAYYDSSVAVLPKDIPNYDIISNKKKSLASLVTNLNIISFEDSVQRLAKDSVLRNNVIADIIRKVEEDEKKKQEEKENPTNFQVINNQTNQNQGGNTFVMYNPAAASSGALEFIKKWGDRPLEDNWRRINKQDINMQVNDADPYEITDDSSGIPITKVDKNPTGSDKKTKEYYMKNIPLTVESMEKSTAKIIDAYYNVGTIYKEQLLNNEKSADAFEELLRRFKENKHKLSTYYQLYRLYTAMGNQKKADFYKNIILTEHGDTEYANLIKNPEYFKDQAQNKSAAEKYYSETFTAFTEARYDEVIGNARRADSLYPKNHLMPKFDFLRAMSIGKTQGQAEYERALTQITIRYPKDEVKPKAEEILALLKKAPLQAPKDSTPVESSIYKLQPAAEHFIVIVASGKKVNINQLKTRISDFNKEFYSTAVLNIGQVGLQNDLQLVSVKSFANADKAIEYYSTLRTTEEVFKNISKDDYYLFAISSENYTAFYKDKDIQKYMKFFRDKYPSD